MNIFILLIIAVVLAALVIKILQERKALFSINFAMIPVIIAALFYTPNFSHLDYGEAFTKLNKTLEMNYPLADWKAIDYGKLKETYAPLFSDAASQKDRSAYVAALREYLSEFNDSHIQLSSVRQQLFGCESEADSKLRSKHIGGSYGLSITQLDNECSIVSYVRPGGSADKAGIKFGDIVHEWNDKPVAKAAEKASLTWVNLKVADAEALMRMRYLALTRASIGSKAVIVIPDEKGQPRDFHLTADEDSLMDTQKTLEMFYRLSLPDDDVSWRIIENKHGKHGYIRIATMTPSNRKRALTEFKEALVSFAQAEIADTIIDIRNNRGGDDEYCAELIGMLTTTPSLHTSNCVLDKTRALVKKDDILITPNFVGYKGDIIVLVNDISVSAAEGFAYRARLLPNCKTASITGTNGSFGTIGEGKLMGAIRMPHGYVVIYPRIACCDETGRVMIDADASGRGGVTVDVKIPYTESAARLIFVDKEDYELNYVLNELDR